MRQKGTNSASTSKPTEKGKTHKLNTQEANRGQVKLNQVQSQGRESQNKTGSNTGGWSLQSKTFNNVQNTICIKCTNATFQWFVEINNAFYSGDYVVFCSSQKWSKLYFHLWRTDLMGRLWTTEKCLGDPSSFVTGVLRRSLLHFNHSIIYIGRAGNLFTFIWFM